MRRESPKPDINVTPLVDVVLVLLIIFMVVTPQMQAGAAVDLPGIKNPDPKTQTKLEPITLSVTAAGNYFIEKEIVTLEALPEKLKEIHTAEPTRKAIVKADRAAPYGKVRTLFKHCQTGGFPGVAMQVGELKQEGASK